MHFTYRKPDEGTDLKQGDMLRRDGALAEVLAEWHPTFAKHHDYSFLVVLNQSCDLVLRNRRSKARYIVLAAARPLETLLGRVMNTAHRRSSVEMDNNLCSKEQRPHVKSFLRKLLNNNVPEYFYLESEPEIEIDRPHVVFASLSVPIRAIEHYEKCQKARFGGLCEIFQAKFGSVIGDLYSRVGTPDWVPAALSEDDFELRLEEMLDSLSVWVPPRALAALKDEQTRRRKELKDKQHKMPTEEVDQFLQAFADDSKRRRGEIYDAVVKQVSEVIPGASAEQLERLKQRLANLTILEKALA